MSKNKKTFLSRIFNPVVRVFGLRPVAIDHIYNLFADYGADPNHQNIESLKQAMDKAILDIPELSKRMNCFRAENIFMENLIALRMEVEEYSEQFGYVYPSNELIGKLFAYKDSFLNRFSILRHVSSDMEDIGKRIQLSAVATRLRNLSEKFDIFFETVDAEKISDQLELLPYGQRGMETPTAQRTWDVYLLEPGEAKVDIEGLSAVLHSFGTYNQNPDTRKINMRDTLYTVMDWVETYGETSEGLGEVRDALAHIQDVLSHKSKFYDPRYIVVNEEALFALDKHRNIFLETSIALREKGGRTDAIAVPDETFISMAEKLYQVASALPVLLFNSMITSSHRPHSGYRGPKPPSA